ncbi:hypothetical protein IU433_12215 [Nocardia puris]|nr:hypothetical protein [Nocardia puris]
MGLRLRQLGTDELTWRDLKVIIKHLPDDAALRRAIHPDSGWGIAELLLAQIADKANWLAWTKTKAAQKGRGAPKPIPRPGVEPVEKIGNTVMTLDQAEAFLGYSMRG